MNETIFANNFSPLYANETFSDVSRNFLSLISLRRYHNEEIFSGDN